MYNRIGMGSPFGLNKVVFTSGDWIRDFFLFFSNFIFGFGFS